MHIQYRLHGRVLSVHLRYSTICTMLVRQFNVALFAGVTFACFATSTHIDHFVLTFVSLFDSDSRYFLAFCSSLLLYTKNAIHPHSTLLSAERSKSPSASLLYASVESANCLEYKLYLVTCERFSVHWVNQTTTSTPVWSVFWLTVRSNIDLQFTGYCVLNCCVGEGILMSRNHQQKRLRNHQRSRCVVVQEGHSNPSGLCCLIIMLSYSMIICAKTGKTIMRGIPVMSVSHLRVKIWSMDFILYIFDHVYP
jgi:hypothetical protein